MRAATAQREYAMQQNPHLRCGVAGRVTEDGGFALESVGLGRRHLVALTGLMGSGKTAVANYLRDYYDFRVVTLAAPLKIMAQHSRWLVQQKITQHDGIKRLLQSLPWTDPENAHRAYLGWCDLCIDVHAELEGDGKPRNFLQRMGTEVCRSLQHDIWVQYLLRYADPLNHCVCDDMRFRDEASLLNANGWLLCRVVCDDHERQMRLAQLYGGEQGQAGHASEREQHMIHCSYRLCTGKDREVLERSVDVMCAERDIKKLSKPLVRQDGVLGIPGGV